jgi:hypothetical protein
VSAAYPLVVERTVFHVVSDALRGCWIIPSPQRVTESLTDHQNKCTGHCSSFQRAQETYVI